MHVGNFAHGPLSHAIEHGQVMSSHMAFNIQLISEGLVICESNIGLCSMCNVQYSIKKGKDL